MENKHLKYLLRRLILADIKFSGMHIVAFAANYSWPPNFLRAHSSRYFNALC